MLGLNSCTTDYPSFFYPKLGALAKEFLPKFETVYYIHNFKGSAGGTLFRYLDNSFRFSWSCDVEY
jgi:hypothetical protein